MKLTEVLTLCPLSWVSGNLTNDHVIVCCQINVPHLTESHCYLKRSQKEIKMEGKIKSLVHTWLAEVDPKVLCYIVNQN